MTYNMESATARRVDHPVDFGVLGPVTVVEGTSSLDIGGPKQRTVLAMLIANHGRPVSNDLIAQAVYGEDAPDQARRRVQVYVSTLRSLVGDVIAREGEGWALRTSRNQIDALQFEDLYESSRTSTELAPEAAGQLLRDALALWRGRAYADIESHGHLEAEISRLTELRISVQAARIDADLAAGRHADLIGEIEALTSEHPYLERFRAQHMLALYRSGRQQEALRSYQRMRTLLVDELGVEPTPELRQMEQLILEQDGSLLLTPQKQIQRKAILVADPGDPVEIARLQANERERLLDQTASRLQRAVEGRQLLPAGAASYVVFDNVGEAIVAAETLTAGQDTSDLRIAIDFGDVEVADGSVTGAPVTRASVLVSAAHKGQVLLSADAHRSLIRGDEVAGLRFESLGRFELAGVLEPAAVYQLLTGDPPTTFPPLDTKRTPIPLPDGASRAVPGYELREPIGSGSAGTLFRAYQPSVGREVMVEVIGRADASDPSFVRNFEADAQRLALLEHPNINPLLDYWRDTEGAFLVYPFHRGGFLDPENAHEPDRLLNQVGSALAYAHSYGLVHGSLRPDRIVLDESGNAYLFAFPIASVAPSSSPRHAAYIAPEAIAGEPASVETDGYTLGLLAYELIEGPVPGDELVRPTSPVIAKALSEAKEDRYRSVEEFLAELYPTEDEPGSRFTATRNPYKGLSAFQESDADDFHGRETAVAQLTSALSGGRFVAVVGPSGAGKSSLVRAGLIPALRRGAVPGSDSWVITDMIPGAHPFHELQRALTRVAVDLPPSLRERIAENECDALNGIDRLLPDGSSLLLVVDQFEELFTLADEGTARAFLDLLLTAVEEDHASIVLTLRADFLDRPLLYSDFGELLRESMMVLRAPNASELSDAIVKPARGVGVHFDPVLVQRIVSEIHDRPGALPLLQHSLAELFESRSSDEVGNEDFEGIGGVTGSLARQAESIYEKLERQQQRSIKQAFLRLVTVVDDSPPTRRRVRLADLEDLRATDGIDAFARNRLLVFDTDPDTRTPTVEVAHEALLSHWPRLAGWIEATREDLTLSRRLEEAIRDWESNERDEAYLLTGGRLSQHQAWTADSSLVLTAQQKEFLAISSALDEQRRVRGRRRRNWTLAGFASAAVVASVLGLMALRSADTAREQSDIARQRELEAEASAAAAEDSAEAATEAAALARSESLAANALIALETDPELALLLAVEAVKTSPTLAATSALHQGLQADRATMMIPQPGTSTGAATAIDPTGERVAMIGVSTSLVEMWEKGATEPTWQVRLSEDVNAAFRGWSHMWFSEDGNSVFVPMSASGDFVPPLSPDHGLYQLDVATGDLIDFFHFPCLARAMPAGRHFAAEGRLWAFDWAGNPDPNTCHWYEGRPGAGVVDLETGDIVFETELSPGRPPTLSADGRLLAVAAEYFIDGDWHIQQRVFDTSNGDIVLEETFSAGSAVLSQDGSRILLGQNPTYLYDVETGQRLQSYQGDFTRVFFSPDEAMIIGVATDGIRLFDTENGTELMHLRGDAAGVQTAAVDLQGDTLVSSAVDARVWDIAERLRGDLEPLQLEPIEEGRLFPGAVSRGDEFMIIHRGRVKQTINNEPTPHRVDLVRIDDGETLRTEEVWNASMGPGDILFSVPILEKGVTSPSGVADAVKLGSPVLLDAVTGDVITELDDCDWFWTGVFVDPEPGDRCNGELAPNYTTIEFSADGSTVLAATWFGEVSVWDTTTGELLRHLDPSWSPDFGVRNRWGATLSADGALIINPYSEADYLALIEGQANSTPLHVIDVTTGEEIATIDESGFRGWLNDMEHDPASGLIIGMTSDLIIIDPATWRMTGLQRSQGVHLLNQFAISPDGSLVATVGTDEFIDIWDLGSRSLRAEIPVVGWIGEGLRGIAFEDESTLIVAPEAGNQLLRFSIDSKTLLDQAFLSLDRGFLPEECATYGIDPCPTLEEMRP